jgi:neutral ceramidase
MLQIGAAQVDITPPVGLAMDGYLARVGVNLGTHDLLQAQVLLLADDNQRAAIVTLDVLAVSAAFADTLRQSLASIFDTSTDAVMICASHTHCGPAGLRTRFGESPSLDSQLTRMIHTRVSEAGQVALGQLAPAQVSCAGGEVNGIGGERNHKDRVVDSRVTVLRFDAADGAPIAILFHYACHPTVLGADTRLYSADFPGAARSRIQSAYPGSVCLYLNGAAGNVSTRFTRRAQSFDEVQRLGGLLGSKVVALLDQPTSGTSQSIAWDSHTVELPFRTFGESHLPPPTGNQRIDQTRAEGAFIETQLRQTFAGRTMQPATLHVLHIGLCRLAFVPGEPFNDLAMAVRETLVVGYANNYLGYFPTQSAMDDLTYEALSSPYDARAHDIIQMALAML